MHWDQREQAALRDAGLSTEDLKEASAAVADATAETADALTEFFAAHDTVYSDMDIAHSTTEYPEHTVDHVDVYTHSADLRGYLKFDTWGVPIEDGRVLTETMVELTLGPTVNGRTRFASTRDEL
ncbi:DUF7532 family protein [Natronomonas sp. EA1]|uniref:DUF7532 family protein n=1 Tax=Natronomonas sp. EA1 TaxID=3421655 RepID=UPI003EBEF70D